MMEFLDVNTLRVIWYLLVGVLIIGYAILDGFDLGVGVLHLFTGDEHERRIHLNAIGPVWDGNEVWLLTGGGALFAAFPFVYATVFSGFYIAFMLLLTALICRAVSFEFRGKVDSQQWRAVWDWAFGLGSLVPALLYGVAIGNVMRGLPIDKDGTFTGTFLGLLNPYSLLIGVVSLVLFTLHGAVYLTLKTDGAQKEKLVRQIPALWIMLVVLYFLASAATAWTSPFLMDGVFSNPLFYVLVLLMGISLMGIPVLVKRAKYFPAFLSSSAAIASMVATLKPREEMRHTGIVIF
ncbi:MAG: cytochrome d ubiquinol oxidase subunit II [Ignavibacteriales bacterium]|nr:cytochrome d ubiquinol oxidase subunit II [Ignavibacteriales bacterium]